MTYVTGDDAVTLMQRWLLRCRGDGLKKNDRFAEIARWLGVKPRRVRAIVSRETARIPATEYESMLDAWGRYLNHKAANTAQQIAAIQARKASR